MAATLGATYPRCCDHIISQMGCDFKVQLKTFGVPLLLGPVILGIMGT